MTPEEVLEAIRQEVLACTACRLHQARTNAVPGEGPADAEVMFIGEGPGFHEDRQGRPFVGAAGQFLEELLGHAGLRREQVYITNVVKCRPPGNRDPGEDEVTTCTDLYLWRQIEAVNPRVIVTLGRFSMGLFFPNARISQIHGQPKVVNGRLVVPMYHPAAALHQPALRRVVEEDFARLPGWIEQARTLTPDQAEPPDEPQQLSLF